MAPPGGPGPFTTGPQPTGVQPAAVLWPSAPEPPRRRREGMWLALAVLLAALVVIGGAMAWQTLGLRGDSDDSATQEAPDVNGSPNTAPPTVPPNTAPPNTAPPAAEVEHAPCPATVPEEICEAAAFIEQFRGRPFQTFPTVELVDDEAFAERLLRDFKAEREDIEITNHIWRSLGFIEPEDDLVEILTTLWDIGVVGAYFPETDELYVQGTDLDLYARMVVVHELVHAHDDQWLDLDRVEYEDADDEIGYGFSAVVEGNAQRVERAWRATLSQAERNELAALEASVLSAEQIRVFSSLPPILVRLQISPYVHGEALVNRIAADGGEDAVDAALADPPSTSKEVLHPELLGQVEVIEVSTPPTEAAAPVLDEGVVGELVFTLWFDDRTGEGWGGDRYVTWTTPSGACTRIDVVGDTERDTAEYEVAATRWASAGSQRSVERLTVGALDLVRITGCY